MTLEEIGSIGEAVGGAAVVVTLIYLAAQVRQNTQSNRYLATQNLVAGQAEANFRMSAEPGLARVVQEGVMKGIREDADPAEQLRFNAFMVGIYRQFDFAFHQHRRGQLDHNVWEWLEYEIPVFLGAPGLKRWWAGNKPRFSSAFVEYVDRRLAERPDGEVIPTMGVESSR